MDQWFRANILVRKKLNLLVVVIVAALAVAYFTVGPSFFIGGPKNSDIVATTRSVLAAAAPSPSEAERAQSLSVKPKGLCNHNDDGSYACIVEITDSAAEAKSFVAVMKRDANGAWIAAE